MQRDFWVLGCKRYTLLLWVPLNLSIFLMVSNVQSEHKTTLWDTEWLDPPTKSFHLILAGYNRNNQWNSLWNKILLDNFVMLRRLKKLCHLSGNCKPEWSILKYMGIEVGWYKLILQIKTNIHFHVLAATFLLMWGGVGYMVCGGIM
jgi:hypothetical protein